MGEFSHLDEQGRLRMVDISDKRRSDRSARACGQVRMEAATVGRIYGGEVPKGDVLACAKIAAIAAAKRTAELIPLCHPIALSWIDLTFEQRHEAIAITAVAKASDSTGVEMEALTAVSVAALTIYDMCKAVDRTMQIEGVRLLEKRGGRSDFVARDTGSATRGEEAP